MPSQNMGSPYMMFNRKLPLWKRVIFVDWNGVLSVDRFWFSILSNRRHPLFAKMNREVNRLFSDSQLIERWMLGEITSNEIVTRIDLVLDNRFNSDYLERRLYYDCQRMTINRDLVEFLADIANRTFIVIATDNMDCFQIQCQILSRPDRPLKDGQLLTLRNALSRFDDVICSSHVGVLKRDARSFYFAWLRDNRLSFESALLLDDGEENCSAFRNAGGTAIRVISSDLKNGLTELRERVSSWLDGKPEVTTQRHQTGGTIPSFANEE